LVRHIPNEPSQREREPLNERGHRHNLLVSGQIRLLVNVDDFQVIPTFKCCSQTCLIFSIARDDFNVDPLTYKRKTYFAWREWEPGCSSFPADPGFRFPAGLVFFGGFFM
jgi:hypothetical protein